MAPKEDSRAIAWVSFCPFTSGPYFVIWFASAVSDTSSLFCYTACSSWYLGSLVAGALVMIAITACVGSKDFIAFTQDNAISWDVDELDFTIFLSTNAGTGA